MMSIAGILRSMRSIRAKRLAQVIDESEVKPRAKQSSTSLPDPWDDIGIAAFKIKNWKRFRKTRYKT